MRQNLSALSCQKDQEFHFFKISNIICALGLDIIETVFNVCDGIETEEGLTFFEVMENHCLSHLTSVFGVLEEDVAGHFQTIDENGDGLISKQEAEVTLAFDPFDRYRDA